MKKLLLVIVSVIFLSGCSLQTDDETLLYQLAPINAVEIPETLIHGETYQLSIQYYKPTNCHSFDGFDVTKNENEIMIGVVTAYFPENANCEDQEYTEEASLEFYVDRNDFYIFRFWQGVNEDNEPQFMSLEVPIEQ